MPNLEHDEHAHDDHGHHVHVTPFMPMLLVFVGLLCLTALTLWTAKAEYFYVSNSVNLTVALIIAEPRACSSRRSSCTSSTTRPSTRWSWSPRCSPSCSSSRSP